MLRLAQATWVSEEFGQVTREAGEGADAVEFTLGLTFS